MGQNAKYAYVAMANAIEDAGLKPEEYESNPRVGGILGQADTSAVNIDEVCKAVEGGKSVRAKIGPYRVTRTMSSSVSAVLSTLFKVQGTSYSIGSACATSAHCIGTGMQQIQLGIQDIVFCGAGESGGWRSAWMFDAMGALSTQYNDAPETASRAFDTERDGFVFGAGGGVLVLESLESATKRGAKIYGELTGYAATSDGYDMVAPSGEGGGRAMKMAMEMADKIGGERRSETHKATATAHFAPSHFLLSPCHSLAALSLSLLVSQARSRSTTSTRTAPRRPSATRWS